MPYLTVGELAKIVNITKVTIRYYERTGLIPIAKRKNSGYRLYHESIIDRIHFIKNAKWVGFTLQEIKEILSLIEDSDRSSQEVKVRTLNKLQTLEEKIDTLKKITATLKNLTNSCDGKVSLNQCPILKALHGNNFQ